MRQRIIAFRTDASIDIGIGHVMRCLTLADALRDRGAQCQFICRAHRGNLVDIIRQRGHVVHTLPILPAHLARDEPAGEISSQYGTWLGADWATDADQTNAVLRDSTVDWLVVDHYAIGARWELRLRDTCGRLMVIDDLACNLHACDLLLDQNMGRSASDYQDLVSGDCTILTGPAYALLRPEFTKLRPYSLARRAKPELKHLLVSMGGVDKDNVTSDVLIALKDCSLPTGCHITVVMGPHAPWLEQVRVAAKQLAWATRVRVNVNNMARIMADSDLALGATGTTALERCCLGLPALVVILADNQREGAQALESADAISLLGTTAGEFMEIMVKHCKPTILGEMVRACSEITDGTGVFQIAELLTNE